MVDLHVLAVIGSNCMGNQMDSWFSGGAVNEF